MPWMLFVATALHTPSCRYTTQNHTVYRLCFTAPHCNATHCNTQGIALVSLHSCNTAATQHTATHCNTQGIALVSLHSCNTAATQLQHNTPQHTATHRVSPSNHNSTSLIHTNASFICVTPDSKVTRLIRTRHDALIHVRTCSVVSSDTTYCDTSHCKTLQHTNLSYVT